MRFYVTIKRWSHLMLPSNKQIPQSLAEKFKITLKRFWGREEGGRKPLFTSLFNWGVKDSWSASQLYVFFKLYSRSIHLFRWLVCVKGEASIMAKAFVLFSPVHTICLYIYSFGYATERLNPYYLNTTQRWIIANSQNIRLHFLLRLKEST